MKKYYEAYEDRYKQVHSKTKKAWAGEKPSEIFKTLLEKYKISKKESILEVGCGEGQNAIFLSECGYKIDAFDVSEEAINWCKNKAKEKKVTGVNFFIMDALDNDYKKKYNFIYSVAVLHMLVEEEDRLRFLKFIKDHLNEDGKAVIMVMGDGKMEKKTDIKKAFDLSKRKFGEEIIEVAETSCRIVKWEKLLREIKESGLNERKHYIDESVSGFSKAMIVEVENKN